jgi:hypothetical protein
MTTPPAIPPAAKTPPRWQERYGYMWCDSCGFEARYCGCSARSPDAEMDVGDGDFSSLAKRIAEVRRMMGGRD